MKKLLTIVALMVLGATTSFAQLGLRGGLNFNSLGKAKVALEETGNGKEATESKIGFHLGAVYNIDLIGSFALEPGFYFTQKGFKLNDDDANFNYLEVPVNVKWKLLDLSIIGVDTHIGPFAALALGGKWKTEGETWDLFKKSEGNSKRFDFGLQMGIGVTLIKKIYAGVNYDMSLTKVDTNLGISKDNLEESNHVWMVTVGLNF